MLRLVITGNLGGDPHVVETTEKPFVAFNVAEQGFEKPQWVDCTFTYKHGQPPAWLPFLKKGKSIYVEGRPYVKVYTPKSTEQNPTPEPHPRLCLLVERIELTGKKDE